jgi:hypothetical protein
MFDIEVTRSWEFNTTFPIRSVAIPYLVVGLPYSFLKYVAPFMSVWFNISVRTPYILLVLPRLFACLLSFVSDYSMYRICCLYSQNYRARLLTLASSYITLVYGTRTFSNTAEMALNSLLLYFVAYCMRHSDQVRTTSDHILALKMPISAIILFWASFVHSFFVWRLLYRHRTWPICVKGLSLFQHLFLCSEFIWSWMVSCLHDIFQGQLEFWISSTS